MEISTLETVVFEQRELFAKDDASVPRSVDFNKYIETEQIVIISGVRRSGKSTLLRQFASHFTDYRYLNFDDERLIRFEVDDFAGLMLSANKNDVRKSKDTCRISERNLVTKMWRKY